MNSPKIDRRKFIGWSAGAAVAMSSFPAFAYKPDLSAFSSFGLQLYTVRDQMAKDVAGTLKQIASFGYKEVEFAGYFDVAPAEIKKILVGEGLIGRSAHFSLEAFRDDMEKALDTAAEIGHEHVDLPYLQAHQRKSMDDYRWLADLLNEVGVAANKRGIRFGYHNHEFEFEKFDGEMPYDLLLDRVSRENMQFTMDLYWMAVAKQDPIEWFKNHPGRFEQCHIKDMDSEGTMVTLGDGQLDFAKYLSKADIAGLKHCYVEHDNPVDSLESARRGAIFMQKLTS